MLRQQRRNIQTTKNYDAVRLEEYLPNGNRYNMG
jgi:hypothetical protein